MSQMQINMTALYTLARREVVRFSRIWPQTVMPSAVTMTLYFLVFGKFIGSRVGDIGGSSYVEFIAPGLIMIAVITNAYSNSAFAFYICKFQNNIEELLIAPVPSWVILSGFAIAGVLRGLAVGIVVIFVAIIFGGFAIHHFWTMLSIILLSSLLFSLAGLCNGVFAKKFDDISFIPTFVLTPLSYLGGVFYSVDLLSPMWKHLSMINPILYIVNAFRYGIIGLSDISIVTAFAILLLFIIALIIINLSILEKGIGVRS